MQADILFLQTPLLPGVGSKGRKTLKVVMLYFKLKGIEHHGSTLVMESKGQKFFPESSPVA